MKPAPIPTGVYIHIPFCRQKCHYCDFNSYPGMEGLFVPYVEALGREMALVGQHVGPLRAETLYIGGGTPTVLPPALLARVIALCKEHIPWRKGAEVTVEANPGTVDAPYLEKLLSLGVQRLSLGAQSFHDDELALLGRIHRASDVADAVQDARRAGFRNINLDLIYGLPGQTLDRWHRSLEEAISLEPEHISLYALTLEEHTPLARRIAQGELPPPDDDAAADMYILAEEALASAGYHHYEISNWAKPGFQCRHNLRYWRNLPYIGLGAGAHSWWGSRRWHNVAHPAAYIRRLESTPSASPFPSPAAEGGEAIDLRTEMAETVILGLRLVEEGVRFTDFTARFGRDLREVYGPQIQELVELGLLEVYHQGIRLTTRGRLLGNEAFERFV